MRCGDAGTPVLNLLEWGESCGKLSERVNHSSTLPVLEPSRDPALYTWAALIMSQWAAPTVSFKQWVSQQRVRDNHWIIQFTMLSVHATTLVQSAPPRPSTERHHLPSKANSPQIHRLQIIWWKERRSNYRFPYINKALVQNDLVAEKFRCMGANLWWTWKIAFSVIFLSLISGSDIAFNKYSSTEN